MQGNGQLQGGISVHFDSKNAAGGTVESPMVFTNLQIAFLQNNGYLQQFFDPKSDGENKGNNIAWVVKEIDEVNKVANKTHFNNLVQKIKQEHPDAEHQDVCPQF